MAIKLYMDHHVPRAITEGLRLRGVDVLTAEDDKSKEFTDSELLDRASESGRILFTQDYDLLAEAAERQRTGQTFGGVIYAHQLRVPIGGCVHDLEIIAKVGEPEDLKNGVQYLPI